MRILPTALALSAVIHGGAIAWALAHEIEARPVVSTLAPIEIDVVPVPAPETPPVDVALLDHHTVAPSPSLGAVRRPTKAAAIATEPARKPEVPAEPARPVHSPLMGMREPKKPDLAPPSGGFIDDFLSHSKPLAPRAIESDQIGDDYRTGEAHLHDAGWMGAHTGEEIAEERKRTLLARQAQEGHELQQKGTGYEAKHAVFNGTIEADGTAHIDKKRRYDPTEIIMNRHNIDPYASNKLRMLDDTREERYEIGKAYKKKQLAGSAVLAQKNLAYLWAHTTDPAQRKQELFEMWDECAERGSDELVAGGTAARAVIIGFIKGRMTGPSAYTADELAAFNAKKKSSAAFAPYAD